MDPVTASLITQAVLMTLRVFAEVNGRAPTEAEREAMITDIVEASRQLVRTNTARLREAIDNARET